MKNTCMALLTLVLFARIGYCQKTEGGFALNAGAGLSMMGLFGSIDFSLPDGVELESKSTTAWTGGVDIGLKNHLSCGISGGHQSVHQKFRNYEYVDSDGNTQVGEFTNDVSRINVGVRILYHFGGDRIDAYAGVKPGINIYQFKTTETIPTPSWVSLNATTFAFQVIPIGVRAYINDYVGLFFETGIGAPSFISGGICIGIEKPTETSSKTQN
jgi:hypothetical protein